MDIYCRFIQENGSSVCGWVIYINWNTELDVLSVCSLCITTFSHAWNLTTHPHLSLLSLQYPTQPLAPPSHCIHSNVSLLISHDNRLNGRKRHVLCIWENAIEAHDTDASSFSFISALLFNFLSHNGPFIVTRCNFWACTSKYPSSHEFFTTFYNYWCSIFPNRSAIQPNRTLTVGGFLPDLQAKRRHFHTWARPGYICGG